MTAAQAEKKIPEVNEKKCLESLVPWKCLMKYGTIAGQ